MLTALGYPWHRHLLAHVQQSLADNRVPHAMLYRHRPHYFDEQLGKDIATLLLCENHEGSDRCQHCRLMHEDSHPNVIWLQVRKEKVGINEVRDLEQQMWQTAVFDKPKIAIIDGLDELSIGAQNALLKTLEEPPKNTFFILAVEQLAGVLPTIMSRVQRLHHNGLADTLEDQVKLWLQQQLGEKAPTMEEIINTARLAEFAPEASLALLQAPELVEQRKQEKKHFAQWIAGRHQTLQLVDKMDKEGIYEQLKRYNHYVEALIRHLFDKMQTQQNEVNGQRQIPRWHGVSLQGLFRLRDVLDNLQRLSRTNVNIIMQLQVDLMDWQNDREK